MIFLFFSSGFENYFFVNSAQVESSLFSISTSEQGTGKLGTRISSALLTSLDEMGERSEEEGEGAFEAKR
jgi:hypothetical protein